MELKIKKTHPNSVTPFYAKPGDAGMDLTAVSEIVTEAEGYAYIEYDTGIAVEIPEGYVGLVFPRSSVSKTGLILANAVGIIDSGYRASIKCRFKWIKGSVKYAVGDKIAQLIILPYPQISFIEVDELSDTERGKGGFGSSGK